MAGGCYAGFDGVGGITVGVAVAVGVPGGGAADGVVGVVDESVTVVVDAVTDLGGAGVDGWITVVTVDRCGRVVEAVAVSVGRLDASA